MQYPRISPYSAALWDKITARKLIMPSEEAARNGCPCVYFWDSGGGRIQEAHFRDVIKCTMLAAKNSGYIPTVSVIMGACAGGSAYAPILNDYMICVDKTSKFFLCGPDVIKQLPVKQSMMRNWPEPGQRI